MNGVLLLFDCLPTGLLGCYGNLRAATPAFDRLAASSVAFDQHIADVGAVNPGSAAEVLCRQIADALGPHVSLLEARDEPLRGNSGLECAARLLDGLRSASEPRLLLAACGGVAAGAEGPKEATESLEFL